MFYVTVIVDEADMDFSFYKDGVCMDEGVVLTASGETAFEAWKNFNDQYKVGAFGRKDYLHPDQLPPGYGGVQYMHRFMLVEIPKYMDDHIGDNRWSFIREPIDEEGCFQAEFAGNWEMTISVSKEAPAVPKTSERVHQIQHGPYQVRLCPNGDIQIEYRGSQIVWVDNHYLNGAAPAPGGEHQLNLPSIVVNAVNQDEPSVCLSIGEDKVFINDTDSDLTEDMRRK